MSVEIDRSKYGYVYKITNLINGKTYVGQRKIVRDKSWEDYYGSGKLIQQAISKYGKENFSKELVSYADSQDELSELENEAITMFKSKGACEYNLVIYTPSPDNWQKLPPDRIKLWKEELSKVQKARMSSEDYVNPRSADFNERYEKFTKKYSVEEISNYYLTYSSISELSKSLNTSPRIITKFLKENNLLQENRVNKGWGKRSDDEKNAISEALKARPKKSKNCAICEETFKYVNDTAQICGSDYCRAELARRRDGKEPKERNQRSNKKATSTKTELNLCTSCGTNKQFNQNLCRKCYDSLFDSKALIIKTLIEEGKSIRSISTEIGYSKTKIRKFMVDNGYEIPKQSADAAHKARKGSISENALFIDCLICGKTVRSKKKTPDRVRKYCSVECQSISRRKTNRYQK